MCHQQQTNQQLQPLGSCPFISLLKKLLVVQDPVLEAFLKLHPAWVTLKAYTVDWSRYQITL